jgi:hypothetical protein
VPESKQVESTTSECQGQCGRNAQRSCDEAVVAAALGLVMVEGGVTDAPTGRWVTWCGNIMTSDRI